MLRSHIDGPGLRRPLPDAIFTQPEESALKSKLADGVEEGYAASYEQLWASHLQVKAVRFSVTPERRPDLSGLNAKAVRIEIGSTWILFAPDRGACSAAIEAHLKSLRK